jgi:hypothetical protein
VQECAFLLQFTQEPTTLKLFTNTECIPAEANTIASNIVIELDKGGFTAEPSGKYSITENDNQTVSLTFV